MSLIKAPEVKRMRRLTVYFASGDAAAFEFGAEEPFERSEGMMTWGMEHKVLLNLQHVSYITEIEFDATEKPTLIDAPLAEPENDVEFR